MSKKTSYLSLLFCLLTASPLLFISGLQGFQLYLKSRVERVLESETLETLSFPVASVQWVEEGREILVEGKMFDIKDFTIKDGVFQATGFFDEDETKVVDLLNGTFTEKGQDTFIIGLLLWMQAFVAMTFYFFHLHRVKTAALFGIMPACRRSDPLTLILLPPP